MSYIANILQVETWPKFSKCPQGAPEWKKNSKFSKIFYFYPKLLKIAFGIIVSSSDNYGHEWVVMKTTTLGATVRQPRDDGEESCGEAGGTLVTLFAFAYDMTILFIIILCNNAWQIKDR